MKVKNNIYPSIDDFKADVILLYKNSLNFNGINYIVTSVALKVRDMILKAISDIEGGKGSTILRALSRGS
jgi:Bromodomain